MVDAEIAEIEFPAFTKRKLLGTDLRKHPFQKTEGSTCEEQVQDQPVKSEIKFGLREIRIGNVWSAQQHREKQGTQPYSGSQPWPTGGDGENAQPRAAHHGHR